jgi:aryl-alcohol dehydrogenase-like predicted oxidoreductase
MYSQGESEILVGKAFRKKRDKVFIATKGGYCLPGRKRLIQLIKPFVKPIVRAIGLRSSPVPAALSGTISQDFSPGHLRKAVEASLRRLQSDHIDLYQIHSPPREELRGTQIQDALGLLERLKAEGKIREYGIALDSVYDAVHCLDMEGLASLQMPFGLMDLQALDGVFDKVSERQLGIIARGCFGGGALKQSLTEAELRASEPQWERALQIKRLAEQMQHMPLDDDTMWQQYRLVPFALAWRMAGNFPPMVSALQASWKMTRMTQNRYQEVQILWGLIVALIASGQLRQAHDCCQDLQRLVDSLGGARRDLLRA